MKRSEDDPSVSSTHRDQVIFAASVVALVVLAVWPRNLLSGLFVAAVASAAVAWFSRPGSRRETSFHD